MVFWRGWGIIGILFPILVSGILAALGLSDENSKWFYFIGLTLSAIPVWFIGKRLNKDKDEVFMNERTGQQFKLGNRHTLFFIPLQYFAVLYPLLGIVPFVASK